MGEWKREKYSDLEITDAILDLAKEQLDIIGFKTPAGDSVFVPFTDFSFSGDILIVSISQATNSTRMTSDIGSLVKSITWQSVVATSRHIFVLVGGCANASPDFELSAQPLQLPWKCNTRIPKTVMRRTSPRVCL